jgi:putative transposase
MHCVWTLPPGDDDFSNRWKAIKIRFVQKIPAIEHHSKVRTNKGERGIWQRRFWEHAIRNERDYANHIDYVHVNPLKHGYVTRVKEWPYSSFHRYVKEGVLPANWAGDYAFDTDTDFGERPLSE